MFVPHALQVYMNVSIGGVVQNGSIVIGLIDDIVPKTTERFRELCTGKVRSLQSCSIGSLFL